MAKLRHDALNLQHKRIVPPSSNKSDLAASTYEPTWRINQDPALILQCAAPHVHRQHASNSSVPLSADKTLTCIDPLELQITPLQSGPSGRFWSSYHSVPLSHSSSESHASPSTRSEHRYNPGKPESSNRASDQASSQPKLRNLKVDTRYLSQPQHRQFLQPSPYQLHMEAKDRDARDSDLALHRPTGKRNRDVVVSGTIDASSQPLRFPKSARLEPNDTEANIFHFDDAISHNRKAENLNLQTSCPQLYEKVNVGGLTDRQKTFIQTWHQSFATDLVDPFPASESVNALATLVQSSPQHIQEYLNTQYGPLQKAPSANQLSASSQLLENEQRGLSHARHTLREANRHLPLQTLTLVEKYVSSCRRRRAQKDGRRSVNEGPLKCTYGCGYQTKRAFDWKRHEETHEPQELWLCHLCCQNKEPNPFLVNRKDKFLRHVKDAHKRWQPETVLEMSRVDFQADFSPSCPLCPEVSKTWDDRCRHVLSHYEVSIQRDSRQVRVQSRRSERKESISDQVGTYSRIRPPSDDCASAKNSLLLENTAVDGNKL